MLLSILSQLTENHLTQHIEKSFVNQLWVLVFAKIVTAQQNLTTQKFPPNQMFEQFSLDSYVMLFFQFV